MGCPVGRGAQPRLLQQPLPNTTSRRQLRIRFISLTLMGYIKQKLKDLTKRIFVLLSFRMFVNLFIAERGRAVLFLIPFLNHHLYSVVSQSTQNRLQFHDSLDQ